MDEHYHNLPTNISAQVKPADKRNFLERVNQIMKRKENGKQEMKKAFQQDQREQGGIKPIGSSVMGGKRSRKSKGKKSRKTRKHK